MSNVSVLIITHNSAAYLSTCLQAITDWGGEIAVVDNASTDGTVGIARKYGSSIRFISNPQNMGFSGAVNQGVRLSRSAIVVILNPDTIASSEALGELLASFADASVGAAGGTLLNQSGQPQRGFQFRRFPTLAAMLSEALLVNRLWPGNPWNRRYRCLDLDDSQPQFVDQPAGACLAVRREAWESVGGFDESFYPVWFEDVDFCRRLTVRGWKIAYRPGARVSHAGGHSVSKLPFRDRQAFWYRNMLRYFAKHHGLLETGILRIGILAGLALRAALSLVGLGPHDVTRGEALRGYMRAARTILQRGESVSRPKQPRVGVAAV